MEPQEDAREGIEDGEAVGGLEVLGPGLLAGQGAGKPADDRHGLRVRGGRLHALAVPLVEPPEEIGRAPVDLGEPAAPEDLERPLERHLRPPELAGLPEHDPEVVEEQTDPRMRGPERPLGDLEGALEVAPGKDVVPERLGDAAPVPERLREQRMIRAQRLLLDPERALDQRQRGG